MSKHQEAVDYIESLAVGKRISVRSLSHKLGVSAGTAYRAIKEAQRLELVTINDRSSTVRIANLRQEKIASLTFGTIAKIANAEILGGQKGMSKRFTTFAIGAMTQKHLVKYLRPGGLLIVGDRTAIQALALQSDNAVLVTGGLAVSEQIIEEADRLAIPIMRTQFDTFSVASRINRVLSNEHIKQDIMTISDIYQAQVETLTEGVSTVKEFLEKAKRCNRSRFPVLNQHQMVVGVISMRDVAGKTRETLIDKLMSRQVMTVTTSMTVINASQKMVQTGFEMLPVIAPNGSYLGVVDKSDVLRSLENTQATSDFARTFSDELATSIEAREGYYMVRVTPFMVDSLGNVATGSLAELITQITKQILSKDRHVNVIIEQMTLNLINTVTVDDRLSIYPKIVSQNRIRALIDLEIYLGYTIISKVSVSVHMSS